MRGASIPRCLPLNMTVDVVTFGCRLNAFECEVIAREAECAGIDQTIVINSCAVTNEAVAQARQSIRRLKRERPGARIIVTGCAAQTQPQMFAEMAEVDRVIGNDDKMRGETWRATHEAFAAAPDEKIAVSDIMAVRAMTPHLVDAFQRGLPRVFVQVQNGCDHRCTFCTIPFGRGKSRSVPILSQAFRPRRKRCSSARSNSSMSAISPSCTCFRTRRVLSRLRRGCRRLWAGPSRSARSVCARPARRRFESDWRERSARRARF